MSKKTQRSEFTRATVVYEIPDMEAVTVRRDVEYSSSEEGALTMDLYRPAEVERASRCPAVVLVSGFPDLGFEAAVGCKFKEMGFYTSWGKLLAASGLTAITYTNRDPAADLDLLLAHIRRQAPSLGIDENRIGLWACSGNVPMALSALMQQASYSFKCAALCYGFMLDVGGSTYVADAAAQFGFVNPCAGKSANEVPKDLPLFLVRAGQDEMPGLNETIDRFMASALIRNLPVTLVNLASAPHAFDQLDNSEASRETIRRILAFLRLHLLG